MYDDDCSHKIKKNNANNVYCKRNSDKIIIVISHTMQR